MTDVKFILNIAKRTVLARSCRVSHYGGFAYFFTALGAQERQPDGEALLAKYAPAFHAVSMRFRVKVAERIIIIAFKMNGTLLLDGAPIHAGIREAVDAQLIIIFEAEMAMRRDMHTVPAA